MDYVATVACLPWIIHADFAFTGEDNSGHFFVGTQDKQLRTAIGKIPAGASMFISVNGLHLEQPSTRQEKVVHQVILSASGLVTFQLQCITTKQGCVRILA